MNVNTFLCLRGVHSSVEVYINYIASERADVLNSTSALEAGQIVVFKPIFLSVEKWINK